MPARSCLFASAHLDTEVDGDRDSVSPEDLAELRAMLDTEMRARLELEEELAELREQMGRVRGRRAPGLEQRPLAVPSYKSPGADSDAPAEASRRGSFPGSEGDDSLGARGEPLFDEAALTRLGIDPRDAAP